MSRRGYAIVAAVVVAVAGVAVALGVRAAGPDGEPVASASPSPTGSPVPVVVPGRPGESASVIPSDQLPAPDGSLYNEADATFVRMMIPHHAQALEMAALATDRAGHPQIRAVASRITAAQKSEIAVFQAWLKARDLSADEAGHSHAGMKGMQSPEAIEGLAGLRGAAFDARFVDMMVAHHEGAIAMATDLLHSGRDERVGEMATGLLAEQQAEIARMRQIPL
ncbi:DUF305 domain-containing protein [Phytohabitans sp. ZYX-F-186]|uniref:DUF305 domain-containing protein n=1 Tax=Phytohabitans maris TaxID=3071409 RepID=A0ABU0ZP41_9ACTN|nr:DUF305 domain-containing protein [Phytohabitans sp. ZYX-F-186]MDQ7908805.1 DUF305 domain-containing protein [Phytohabitans sp. ZYX-F-186]